MGALFLAWHSSGKLSVPWFYLGRWGLGSIALLMITTELSSEIFINATVFMVLVVAGMNLNIGSRTKPNLGVAKVQGVVQ